MRVSTAQFYLQSAQQMSQKSADVNEQMEHLSSGKRVLTAKDDAVAYGTLSGFNNDLANIEKYKRNITMAENHNSMQEVIFADAETLLDKIKQDMILANNGRMSSEDLQAIADQVRNGLDQLVDLGNSQNEQGDYIFSGYQIQQKPFSQQADGSVNYNGDTGVNELQVAKNINIATNQTGDAVFLKIANAIGDFKATYDETNTSGAALASANVTDRSAYNTSALPHDYTFTFDTITNDLTVTDSSSSIVFPPPPATSTPYIAGETISFDGIKVALSGNPLPGDNFTMSEQKDISIFETINDAITWMESGSVSINQEQHQVDYNTLLDQLNSVMNHIYSRRADAGTRLQVLENQQSKHLDVELNISKGKSSIEDLDFAKAISEFEQSKIALQASQQTFSKVQGLSLFNYI